MSIILDKVTVKHKTKICLDNINLIFQNNEQWAIYGPNGAGKSTLLKTIMGLIQPDIGTVVFKNLQTSRIAYLAQTNDLNTTQPLTVFELVALGLWHEISFSKGLSAPQKDRVMDTLEQVSLVDCVRKQVSELSRGQLQRAFFARMLVQNADYFLLDEPFNAMDYKTTEQLLNFIVQARKYHKSIIAVIHDQIMLQKYFPNMIFLDIGVRYQGMTEAFDFKLVNLR